MHGDALGPPCSPGQALHSPSSLFVVGGLVNDKLGTIRHRRSGGGRFCGERQHGGFYITPPFFRSPNF